MKLSERLEAMLEGGPSEDTWETICFQIGTHIASEEKLALIDALDEVVSTWPDTIKRRPLPEWFLSFSSRGGTELEPSPSLHPAWKLVNCLTFHGAIRFKHYILDRKSLAPFYDFLDWENIRHVEFDRVRIRDYDFPRFIQDAPLRDDLLGFCVYGSNVSYGTPMAQYAINELVHARDRWPGNLRELELSNCQPKNAAFEKLFQSDLLDGVTRFAANRNRSFGITVMKALTQCEHLGSLRILDISQNKFSKKSPHLLALASNMPALEELDVRYCDLQLDFIQKLANNPAYANLERVRFHQNRIKLPDLRAELVKHPSKWSARALAELR